MGRCHGGSGQHRCTRVRCRVRRKDIRTWGKDVDTGAVIRVGPARVGVRGGPNRKRVRSACWGGQAGVGVVVSRGHDNRNSTCNHHSHGLVHGRTHARSNAHVHHRRTLRMAENPGESAYHTSRSPLAFTVEDPDRMQGNPLGHSRNCPPHNASNVGPVSRAVLGPQVVRHEVGPFANAPCKLHVRRTQACIHQVHMHPFAGGHVRIARGQRKLPLVDTVNSPRRRIALDRRCIDGADPFDPSHTGVACEGVGLRSRGAGGVPMEDMSKGGCWGSTVGAGHTGRMVCNTIGRGVF